jgi:hypothetical protein
MKIGYSSIQPVATLFSLVRNNDSVNITSIDVLKCAVVARCKE